MRASSGNNRTLFGAGLTLLVAGLSACDSAGPAAAQNGSTVSSAQLAQARTAAPGSASVRTIPLSHPTQHGFTVLAAGDGAQGTAAKSLRAAYIGSVQAQADATHSARPVGEDRFRFDNSAQKLHADVSADGVRVVGEQNGERTASASFHLIHYGCKSAPGAKLATVRPSQNHDRASRVSMSRAQVVEWYQNGRLGIEQGFDLKEAPTCRGSHESDPLVLTLEVGHSAGLQPLLMHGQDGSEWLELRDAQNQIALRYSDLYAADADGKALPAHLALDGDQLSLRIDDRGARYPLRVDPLIWAQYGNLYKATDADMGDLFGSAVAIAGDTAVIGAPRDDQGATDAGAAYVFQLSSQGSWGQQAKILSTKPLTGGLAGQAVAISDIGGGQKRLVLGAPGDTAVSGMAAWFVGHGATWTPEAEFSSSHGFGGAVAVAGDRIVVGSPLETGMDGAVVIYEPNLALTPPWNEKAVLAGTVGSGEQLGSSVAIANNAVVVGAPSSDVTAMDAGRIEIWERDPDTASWVRTASLQHKDAATGDRLGASVAIALRVAVAGAPGKSSAAGAAYVFSNLFGLWDQEAKLASAAATGGEGFGQSVAISTDRAVIGIPLRTVASQTEAGALETFTRTGSTWNFDTQITARTALASDRLGSSLAWDGAIGHILTGAPTNDTTTADSGGFYDLVQLKQTGDNCATNLECASGFCVDTVCCESACGGNSDGDCQACANAKTGLANGLCRAATSAVVCRPAAGACDQVELCDGTNLACPTDVLQPASFTCRDTVGLCDAPERCTGSTPDCPPDTVQAMNAVCRPAAGNCDIAERCDGQTKVCPADSLKPSLSVCHLPQGECDIIAYCDGAIAQCPSDLSGVVNDGTACSTGSCQSGKCRAEADLAIAIGGFAASSPQQPLPFTASISNSGPSAASAITIDVTLPAGSSVGNASGTGFTCTPQDLTVHCTRAKLAPGEIAQVSMLLNPPGQATSFNVTAKVAATEFDPNMANNTASFDQGVLSTVVSGSGFGCTAAQYGTSGGSVSLLSAALGLLLLTTMRRRRAS